MLPLAIGYGQLIVIVLIFIPLYVGILRLLYRRRKDN